VFTLGLCNVAKVSGNSCVFAVEQRVLRATHKVAMHVLT
jgi:hypothetical protein